MLLAKLVPLHTCRQQAFLLFAAHPPTLLHLVLPHQFLLCLPTQDPKPFGESLVDVQAVCEVIVAAELVLGCVVEGALFF